MTFKESLNKFVEIPDWKSFVDDNFNRKSGIYSYLTLTEITIHLEKRRFVLPQKVVFMSGFERFRRKSSNETIIDYKGKRVTVIEKIQVIPFGTYERKFKFSGSFSEIVNDILKSPNELSSSFSEKLLDERNYPLYGIDSTIKYPSYILHLTDCAKYSDSSNNLKNQEIIDDNELNVVFKDILSVLNINYNLNDVDKSSIFIIFPLPYVRILENRLDPSGDNEKVVLTIKFNRDYFNVFKSSKIEIKYEIKETNSETIEKSSIQVEYTGKSIYELHIIPKQINKIGLCTFKILVNDIEVNQFSGTYVRGFKINTKIVSK